MSDEPQLQSMGWSGYSCRSCHSVVLVGVAPIGKGSMALPSCPALDSAFYRCEGILEQLTALNLRNLLKALGQTARNELIEKPVRKNPDFVPNPDEYLEQK